MSKSRLLSPISEPDVSEIPDNILRTPVVVESNLVQWAYEKIVYGPVPKIRMSWIKFKKF